MLRRIFVSFLFLPALLAPAMAAVDLVTLPTREGTQLTIYNSEDITMVREHRLLTVKEGSNRIQFSWADTLIDPTSIEFRILDQQDKVDLVDTTFPAGRSAALQWNVKSRIAGKVPVEIRYFTSGITWSADYVGIANADETRLDVTGYVRVTNNSGEQYDNAQTRLVVGKINLVEKIKGWTSNEPGAYVDLHAIAGRVERLDQQHVKYFLDLSPGRKQRVEYRVTYKHRKVGPELTGERKREPL